MGRGSSKVTSEKITGGNDLRSKLLNTVKDNPDFRAFIKENMSNPDFKQFGRDEGTAVVKDLWYEVRKNAEMQNLHEISKEEAISIVRDNIPPSALSLWFRNADSEAKPVIVDSIVENTGTLNAGLNIAYSNYKETTKGTPLSFNEWLNTPQTVYRGDRGQKMVSGDIFTSYTPDRKVAEKFGSNITVKKIKPIDTWGSYQTTGEQEFLIPIIKTKRG